MIHPRGSGPESLNFETRNWYCDDRLEKIAGRIQTMSPNNFPAIAGQQFAEVAKGALLRVEPDQHLQAKSIIFLWDSIVQKTNGHVNSVTQFICGPEIGEKRCWCIPARRPWNIIIVIVCGIVAGVGENVIDNEKLGVR